MRFVALLLALTSTAGAYPFAVPKRTGAEAEFRKRNPQHWTAIATDKRGLVTHVATDDATLVGKKGRDRIVAIRALLRANADLLGFTPETADRLPDDGVLTDKVDAALLGEIRVRATSSRIDITTKFWVDATPKVDQDDIANRLVGKTYEETLGYAFPAPRDCAMTERGRRGCIMAIQETRKRKVTLARKHVGVSSALVREGDTIRLVACADVRSLEDPPVGESLRPLQQTQRSFAPTGDALALPLVVDRVTGDVLHPGVKSCDDLKRLQRD